MITHGDSRPYQEQPVAMGLASSGSVVEVLTNEKGASWSIIVTMPTGVNEDIGDEENCEANTRQTPEMGGLRRILRRANHRVGS